MKKISNKFPNTVYNLKLLVAINFGLFVLNYNITLCRNDKNDRPTDIDTMLTDSYDINKSERAAASYLAHIFGTAIFMSQFGRRRIRA